MKTETNWMAGTLPVAPPAIREPLRSSASGRFAPPHSNQ